MNRTALALMLAAGATVVGAAQQAAVPDLTGGWVRIDTEGSGNFNGLTQKFTPAALTPAASAQAKAAAQTQLQGPRLDFARDPSAGPKGVGEAYVVTEGRCAQATGAGVPLEPNSAAFFVTQTAGKVLITREGPGSRSLYLDGRTHPSLTTWTPTAQGHSIARYENGDLMVETIGLTPGNVTAGGRRSPETMLRERFRLSPDGERLTITYTWEDPKIYVKPHSYSLAFERLPRGSYAIEDWCDPSDPAQRQSIVPPKQLN